VFCFSLVVLDLVEIGLKKNGIQLDRYDGSIPKDKRFDIIRGFQAPTGAKVLLITSGSGGVGLNLFAATTIIIVCPEWSPAKDDQLVGRAYRMGQRESVEVYRLVANHSMDQRVVEVQKLKNNKTNALLDLHKTERDGITAGEARKRKVMLETVDHVRQLDLEEFKGQVWRSQIHL
jgi:SNF2 family DNA or RNA helicase